ncbi:MAG: response regulator transcription factor [Spirochaetales bacterium]|nr:response regulator transcription factor [Spirochaetales bacterium]
MAAARILVVDDEPKIASILLLYLKHEGFQADAAATGREALRLLDENRYRLVILDLMLPDVPGEDICRRIREESDLPVLMLTAKTAESDQLKGFRAGTDDYVTKPFSPRAVMARVRALLRRSRGEAPGNGRTCEFNGGDLVIDTARGEVRRGGSAVKLTASEFRILTALAAVPGRIFSRSDLIACGLGDGYRGDERTVDAHIKNLRRKLADGNGGNEYIETRHGLGYSFTGEPRAHRS